MRICLRIVLCVTKKYKFIGKFTPHVKTFQEIIKKLHCEQEFVSPPLKFNDRYHFLQESRLWPGALTKVKSTFHLI